MDNSHIMRPLIEQTPGQPDPTSQDAADAAQATREGITSRIAGNVRSALAWRRIRAKDLERILSMSYSGVSRRLNATVPFDATEIVILAEVLGVTPGHLIDGEPWPDAATPVRCPRHLLTMYRDDVGALRCPRCAPSTTAGLVSEDAPVEDPAAGR